MPISKERLIHEINNTQPESLLFGYKRHSIKTEKGFMPSPLSGAKSTWLKVPN
jgi:hypothetical protein